MQSAHTAHYCYRFDDGKERIQFTCFSIIAATPILLFFALYLQPMKKLLFLWYKHRRVKSEKEEKGDEKNEER